MSFRKPVRKVGPFGWLQSKKGKLRFISLFTLVHMVITAAFFYWSYSAVMATTDSSDPFSQYSQTLVRISDIFTWPIIYSVIKNASIRNSLPDFSVYVALLLNSLLWALVVFGILMGINSLGSRKKIPHKR